MTTNATEQSGIRLSKTSLGKFQECALCFWLKYKHKLSTPEGISSKVWKGIEREQIAHHERHRVAGTLPPELAKQVPPGTTFYKGEKISMKDLRYWGKGLRFKVGPYEVSTALDDIIQRQEGGKTIYNVYDDKTKSKPTDLENTVDLYQVQADIFDLAMNENKYPTDGAVYFGYWSPVTTLAAHEDGNVDMRWACQVIIMEAKHQRAKDLVMQAGQCLEGPMPQPQEGCVYCDWVKERADLLDRLSKV